MAFQPEAARTGGAARAAPPTPTAKEVVMAKQLSRTPDAAIFIPFALWGVNYLTGTVWGYPFAYCWLGGVAAYAYYGWGMIGLYCVLLYLLYCLFKGRMMDALASALMMMAVIEFPNLFVYLFKIGGNCG